MHDDACASLLAGLVVVAFWLIVDFNFISLAAAAVVVVVVAVVLVAAAITCILYCLFCLLPVTIY